MGAVECRRNPVRPGVLAEKISRGNDGPGGLAHGPGRACKTPADLQFAGLTAEGWFGELLAQLQGQSAFVELPAPDSFGGVLRPYQVRGYSWLSFLRQWGLGACLADDMGLGKTVQTLALIAREWQSHHREPVLLVCPTSVVGNWQKEAARFTPHLPTARGLVLPPRRGHGWSSAVA